MPAANPLRLRALVLAGGQSSRMGSPKYLLPMPVDASNTSSRPLLVHLLEMLDCVKLKHPNDFIECATISVRDQAQRVKVANILAELQASSTLAIHLVVDATYNAGPAQGLLAAYDFDPTAHWLVTGCDYPLLCLEALEQLIKVHHSTKKAVTCFENDQRIAEPLLAIWSPSSLSLLAKLAEDASSSVGPNRAIKVLRRTRESCNHTEVQDHEDGVEFVHPHDSNWIMSVDTKDQWKMVEGLLRPFP